MKELLILQMIAHLLADFIFQPERWCKEKEKNIFSKKLFLHSAIVFICSFLLSFSLSFWWAALIISVLHFGIDVTKNCWIKKNRLLKCLIKTNCLSIKKEWLLIKKYRLLIKKWNAYLFFIDQTFHFIVIIIVTYWFVKHNDNFSLNNPFTKTIFDNLALLFPQKIIVFFCSTKGLLVIFSFIFCLKPANIFIKKIIDSSGISITKDNKNDESLERAGGFIGVLERCLSFILILFGQYEAVGFIIAAKTILRFRDEKNAEAKTEYLLIGSLMSFGIAILLGIFCKEII